MVECSRLREDGSSSGTPRTLGPSCSSRISSTIPPVLLPFSDVFCLDTHPRHRTAITRNRDILPSPQHPHARSLSTLQLGPSVPAPSGWAGGASAGWPRASMQATPNLGSPGAARQEACVLSSVGTGVALPLRIGAVVICWQVGARIGHITAVPFKVGIGAGVRT